MAEGGVYINVDTKDVETYLLDLGKENQLPFAMSKAINETAKLVQKAIQDSIKDGHINLRRAMFNIQSIKIGKWASKSDLLSIIQIDPRAENLERLATGQDHINLNGKDYIAFPNSKVFGSSIIRKENPLWIGNLKFHDTPHGLHGNENTFLIHSGNGTPLILQNTSGKTGRKNRRGTNKKTDNRILYTLVKKSRTPLKLDFYGIAKRIIDQCLEEEARKAVQVAIDTAK